MLLHLHSLCSCQPHFLIGSNKICSDLSKLSHSPPRHQDPRSTFTTQQAAHYIQPWSWSLDAIPSLKNYPTPMVYWTAYYNNTVATGQVMASEHQTVQIVTSYLLSPSDRNCLQHQCIVNDILSCVVCLQVTTRQPCLLLFVWPCHPSIVNPPCRSEGVGIIPWKIPAADYIKPHLLYYILIPNC